MMTAFSRIIAALLLALPFTAHSADLTRDQIAGTISRLLGVDPAGSTFIKAEPSAKGDMLVIDRNALTRQTGISILADHLPETIRLKLVQKNAAVILKPDGYPAYTTKTAPESDEQGVTSARNYSVNASLVGGILGQGYFQADMSGMHYRADDGTHETTAENAFLTLHKNRQAFSPTTIQLGWGGKDITDTHLRDGKEISRVDLGGFSYNLIIGATDVSKAVSSIWRGEPVQKAISGKDQAAVKDALLRARTTELNYGISNLTYVGELWSYAIENFNMKFQRQMCGGCEGRFDIGLDRPKLHGDGIFSGTGGLMPEHVFASGAISGLNLASLIASENALVNPFKGEIFATPTFASQTSFSIPAFKVMAFNDWLEIGAKGYLDIRHDADWSLNGRIEVNIKKGEDRAKRLIMNSNPGPNFAQLRKTLGAGLAMGKRGENGSLKFTIDITDNVVKINGKLLELAWQ